MLKNIFDTHAHYDDEDFLPDLDEVLSSLESKGVCGVINNAANMKGARESIRLSEKYSNVWAAVGVHPHDVKDMTDSDIDELREMSKHRKVVAIGEIGLDYHYNFSPRDVQIKWLERQLELANELQLPVFIHDREAHADTLELLKKYRPKGVIHCFSGSVEMAREILNLGMYIGLGGAVTFKNAKTPVEVARYVPLDRLLLETDAPYMTPVPFRGKRCTSDLIAYTAERIAAEKNITAQQLCDITKENTLTLFTKIEKF
ncbi:MAG: TatD family hydrolase [Clostridia bacterium]|nr:TatD family hydrolase [Clostridia bacterium]